MSRKLVEENLIAQVVAKLKAQYATIKLQRKIIEYLQRDLRTANEQAEYWRNRGMG